MGSQPAPQRVPLPEVWGRLGTCPTPPIAGRIGLLDRTRLGLVDYDGLHYLSDYHDPA